MSKLLIGLGREEGGGQTDTIEVIELKSDFPICKNLPNFPVALYGSIGGLGYQDTPLICGGRNYDGYHSRGCYSLEGNEWTRWSYLNSARAWAAVSTSPFPSRKLIVTGGFDGNSELNSVEVLSDQGWRNFTQLLPVTMSHHCSVLVNATTLMVIGGSQGGRTSPNTYYLNTEQGFWTEGPPLAKSRGDHSCGRIKKNSQSQDLSIIVVGGWNETDISSVEILDPEANEWRRGPDIPNRVMKSSMVEDPNGGVVLLNEWSDWNEYHDVLFQLSHGGADAEWIKMEQKVKFRRNGVVAFLIPDNIVDCY
jgi:hypothetical protein